MCKIPFMKELKCLWLFTTWNIHSVQFHFLYVTYENDLNGAVMTRTKQRLLFCRFSRLLGRIWAFFHLCVVKVEYWKWDSKM